MHVLDSLCLVPVSYGKEVQSHIYCRLNHPLQHLHWSGSRARRCQGSKLWWTVRQCQGLTCAPGTHQPLATCSCWVWMKAISTSLWGFQEAPPWWSSQAAAKREVWRLPGQWCCSCAKINTVWKSILNYVFPGLFCYFFFLLSVLMIYWNTLETFVCWVEKDIFRFLAHFSNELFVFAIKF